MSKLKKIRETHNLTQEELSDKSGISVRTIQRIESGNDPKGQTLKILANSLGVMENELLKETKNSGQINLSLLKIINLSALLFTIIPPVNIVVPLTIMFAKKQFNPMAKQIVSIQILWTINSFIIFMLSSLAKNWFNLGSKFILLIMIFLVLLNVFLILRNAVEIDKKGKLYFRMNFSII